MRTAIIAAVLASCGSVERPADVVSAIGAEYRFEGTRAMWSQADIDAEEARFMDCVSETSLYRSGQVSRALSMARVTVYPDKFQCAASSTGYCNGTEDYQEISVKDLGGPRQSAVAHEMAHWLELLVKSITDYNHTVEPQLWLCQ